ncbi:hypothetical protein TNCT_501121 [Trichonephila clavata]|uniref:Uncharacterized protein n=1 Tax=Trichonephila clavata TaxID=2740835 RepID=A0A8X6L5L0_TRICU|nr:hypothetical protein TNCT_501121 [Trichonephila clavata]
MRLMRFQNKKTKHAKFGNRGAQGTDLSCLIHYFRIPAEMSRSSIMLEPQLGENSCRNIAKSSIETSSSKEQYGG